MKHKITIILEVFGILCLTWLLFYTTPYYVLGKYHWTIKAALKCLLLLSNSFLILSLFYKIAIARTNIKEIAKNTYVFIFSVILFFFIFETLFLFVPRSHRSGNSLASQRWANYYWRKNNINFRGKDVTTKTFQNKTRIFTIGDSFTAGYGIKNPENRYSNQLAKKLPEEKYTVLNMGVNGADNMGILKILLKFPIAPHILIYQYHPNDIQSAAHHFKQEIQAEGHYTEFTGLTRYLIERSYFLNYVYWSFPHVGNNIYSDSLFSKFKDNKIFVQHIRELNYLIQFAKERNIKLAVLTMPFLNYLEESSRYNRVVADYFRSNNIPVLEVSELVKDLPINKRVVNKHDSHASIEVNKRIANALHNTLKKNRYIP